jgi:hypothetical protein
LGIQRDILLIVLGRDDVLAIASIEAAFDHTNSRVSSREVDLVAAALAEDLILLTEHAIDEADDEGIPQAGIWAIVGRGTPVSKDLEPGDSERQVGLNFEGRLADGRRASVKISWEDGYFVATIYTV